MLAVGGDNFFNVFENQNQRALRLNLSQAMQTYNSNCGDADQDDNAALLNQILHEQGKRRGFARAWRTPHQDAALEYDGAFQVFLLFLPEVLDAVNDTK